MGTKKKGSKKATSTKTPKSTLGSVKVYTKAEAVAKVKKAVAAAFGVKKRKKV